MNCVYMKIKLDHALYCKKYNKQIKLSDCKNCKLIEYAIKEQTKLKHSKPMKQRTNKLAKLEKNRFSILTNDMNHCYICHKSKSELHEIFAGRNRLNSMRYGCVIPICSECHRLLQNNAYQMQKLQSKCQIKFEKVYKDIDFLSIFRKNYK